MDTREAYNIWSKQYDSDLNKTRDLEASALRKVLEEIKFSKCLEVGCGTGKNTIWLSGKAELVTAVDISEEMLAKAKDKVKSDNVDFISSDITKKWDFTNQHYDLISFSLVLEHIEDLNNIFNEASEKLITGGYLYVGELHPFKQYTGSKARFENKGSLQILNCFNHNISDFIQSAERNNFKLVKFNEHFDNDDRTTIPRILTLLLKKI